MAITDQWSKGKELIHAGNVSVERRTDNVSDGMRVRCRLDERQRNWVDAEPKKEIAVRAEFGNEFVEEVRPLQKDGKTVTLTESQRQKLGIEPGDEVEFWVGRIEEEEKTNHSQSEITTLTQDDLNREEFDFVKLNRAGEVQHIAKRDKKKTLCNLDLGGDREYQRSPDPSPFDDTCERCQDNIQEGEMNQAELRAWLAEKIEGVEERPDAPYNFTKPETKAIVEYIRNNLN